MSLASWPICSNLQSDRTSFIIAMLMRFAVRTTAGLETTFGFLLLLMQLCNIVCKTIVVYAIWLRLVHKVYSNAALILIYWRVADAMMDPSDLYCPSWRILFTGSRIYVSQKSRKCFYGSKYENMGTKLQKNKRKPNYSSYDYWFFCQFAVPVFTHMCMPMPVPVPQSCNWRSFRWVCWCSNFYIQI